ncbi:hypothetical protein [Acaryochloris sp. CCMEE 5410]|uniref:hypothetical protein n=1 Tax=Acaryochloris sp. CCMEE 5410 TaxID=310037 RepID=UPI0002484715|nr:hypothetical protein [Acaryochloris sp. CCMEE 5410]KAI9129383.1 hypothetical protein ON05_035280 [Acaryochloris sp. CCMEE 5410]
MTHQKTCLYCLNCNYLSGSAGGLYEPPEPDTWECELVNNNTDPAYFDQFSELEETIASTCQYFQPRMAKKCGHCGKAISVPEYRHEFWAHAAYSGEGFPVCGEECRDAATEEAKRQEKRLLADEERELRLFRKFGGY